jgi:hypothetical protein
VTVPEGAKVTETGLQVTEGLAGSTCNVTV